MRKYHVPFLFWLVSLGCSFEEEATISPSSFVVTSSADTVSFDTLIAGRDSFMRRVRLFNRSAQEVTIERIALQKGNSSEYQIIINGVTAVSHASVKIADNDSLLLLIYARPNLNSDDWIAEVLDKVEWEDPVSSNLQQIVLQSWAVSGEHKEKSVICNEHWPEHSATIVKDTLVVDANCRLSIGAGARIFFDTNAVLFIAGQLVVEGSPQNPVLFRSSRMDGTYKQAPGLWNGIYFLEGSQGNMITSAIFENSETGLRIGTPDEDTIPDLIIENTIIRHNSQFGIQAYNSDIQASNLLIYDIGFIPAFHAIGGSYFYNHCTIANFPSQLGSQEPSVVMSDHLISPSETLQGQLNVDITNSILWTGGADADILFSLISEENTLRLSHNIIFSSQAIEENLTSNELAFAHFRDPFNYDFRPDSVSPAVNAAVRTEITHDLVGNLRDSFPDIGAFEFVH